MQRTVVPEKRRPRHSIHPLARPEMRPEVRAVAARHGGVFTRADAVEAGYSEREMKSATSPGGPWVVVRRGCYVERILWEAADDDARYTFVVHAVMLTLQRPAAASHGSPAALLKLPLRPYWRELAHVTRPGVTGSRTEGGIKHHLAGLPAEQLVTADGWPATGPARTAADIAREHGYQDGVVAFDAVLRLGTPPEEVDRALGPMDFWPHVTEARAAARDADGGAQTIGESLMRLMVLELDIGVPETQYEIHEDDRHAAVDVRVGRHLFEFDGHVKYIGRDRGGVDDRPPDEILWDEKQREDWLRRVDGGYGVSRVIWPEMFGAARVRTLRRLYDEYQQTVRRFGRD